MKARLTLPLSLILFASVPALAHHSSSNFDSESEVSVEGTIVDFEWVNPHVYLWVETDADGGRTWEVEGQPPALLRRLGWTPATVHVGDRVMVTGNPGRDPERGILLMESLEKADGKLQAGGAALIALASAEASDSPPATGLSGTWTTDLDLERLGPLMSASDLPLTANGKDAAARYDEAVDNPAIDCVAYPAPIMMVTPDIKTIEVRDDVVVIRGEFDAAERIVHLNVASHEGAEASNQGHSIGRFDGDTLVIDSTNFLPHRTTLAEGVPSSPAKHLIERLALDTDGTSLVYSFELQDPEYLAEALTVEGYRWHHRPDLEFVALPCDQDNARRFAE